ncbi:MAG: DUF655 domain-containing protein [Candidatus Diapherotrites archaeon CG08_land_8_20_14_0_20_34_12]|nr:MAG: DUF655 domain-containing protein [Candidatus Diapherotrites archaeon CG08_land_8_20_14_0_20_34_12]
MPSEDYALVLDYLPRGKGNDFKEQPIVQLIGTEFFTLLEAVPKVEDIKQLEKVYIGQDKREKISLIKRRISYKELTSNAELEIPAAIESIIKENPQKFLDFFNKSSSITLKMHQLELLPGIGKKHVLNLLDEREKGLFASFEDITKRVSLMPDPAKAIVKRVISELQEEEKYYVFTRKPIVPEFRKDQQGFNKGSRFNQRKEEDEE